MDNIILSFMFLKKAINMSSSYFKSLISHVKKTSRVGVDENELINWLILFYLFFKRFFFLLILFNMIYSNLTKL